jgi:hypothetical protein
LSHAFSSVHSKPSHVTEGRTCRVTCITYEKGAGSGCCRGLRLRNIRWI